MSSSIIFSEEMLRFYAGSCIRLEEDFYQLNEKLISSSQKIKNSIDDFIVKLQYCHDNFNNENKNDYKMKLIFQFIKESQINENMKPIIKECNNQLEDFGNFYKEFNKTILKIKEKRPSRNSKNPIKLENGSDKNKNNDPVEQTQEDHEQNQHILSTENDNDNKNEEKENLVQAINELEQLKTQLQKEIIQTKKEENQSKAKATLLQREMNDFHIDMNNKLKDLVEKMDDINEIKLYIQNLYNKKPPKLHNEDEDDQNEDSDEVNILKMNDQQKVDYFNNLVDDTTENRFNIKAQDLVILTQKFETVNEDQFKYLVDIFNNKISKGENDYQIIFSNFNKLKMEMVTKLCHLEGFKMCFLSNEVLSTLFSYFNGYITLFNSTGKLFQLCEELIKKVENPSKEIRDELIYTKRKYYNLLDKVEKEIFINEGSEEVEDNLLQGSKAVKLTIPKSVKKIGNNSFYQCLKLTTVILNCIDLEEIGKSAFSGCASLIEIVLPQKVTIIKEHTFKGCEKLKKIVFPDKLEQILKGAFSECTSLTEVKLPQTIKQIGKGAFKKCNKLKHVVIPGVLYIHSNDEVPNEIQKSSEIKEFQIPEKCFYKCESLQNIVLLDGCQIIGQRAFSSCTNILGIKMNVSKGSVLGEGCFQDCNNVMNVEFNVNDQATLRFESSTFKLCGQLREVIFNNPDSFESNSVNFGSYVFSQCKNLLHFTFPSKSEVDIGDGCFECCQELTKVVLPPNVIEIKSKVFKDCINLESVNIHNETTIIHKSAFENCNKLMLDNAFTALTRIGMNAFKNCKLISFSFPDTLLDIEENAFEGCEKIEEITIPKNVQTIKKYAFLGCKELTKVKNLSNHIKVHNKAFSYLPKLKIVESVETKDDSFFYSEKFYCCPKTLHRHHI